MIVGIASRLAASVRDENFMKPKFFLRALAVGLCAGLLLFVNRPTTHHLSHPYTAPDFELTTLNGDRVRLSDFRGKAVLLNFWATWCAPCRREIPWFIEFQKEYGPKGLRIIGVSMDEGGRDAIASFVRRTGIDYPVLLGDTHVSSLYGGLEVLPTTYYISPRGNVVALVNGVIRKAEVERDIKEALGSNPQK
jgi:cytochrome c biogenesis protein CcmG/thiol:disulfide interchange protein DsbE